MNGSSQKKNNLMLVIMLCLSIFASFSPAAAQDKACVFCEIAAGTQKSRVVYQDSSVLSFLAHAPDNPGHLLVVPVTHARYFTDIPDSTLANMMRVAKYLIRVLQSTDIPAEGFQLLLNSGEAAGQHIKHAHLHIIPRFKGEVLNTTRKISPDHELDAVAGKIKKAILQINK